MIQGTRSFGLRRITVKLFSFLASAIFTFSHPVSAAPEGIIHFSVRDQANGFGIPASLEVFSQGKQVAKLQTDSDNVIWMKSIPGNYEFVVLAPGYQELSTRFQIMLAETLQVELKMERLPTAGAPKKSANETELPANIARISGYVTDATSGKPLAGVSVIVGETGKAVESDKGGFYSLDVPVSSEEGDRGKKITLAFTYDGYKKNLAQKYLVSGDQNMNVALERGDGETSSNETQGARTDKPDLPSPNPAADQPQPLKKKAATSTPYLVPPTSIRVGTTCGSSRTSCRNVQVMTFESYVAGGLGDEWISSWNLHALRAGAIAFRSYAAAFTKSPATANYDICASTYCQVWDADQDARSAQAATETAGMLMEKNGATAGTEYSAENNNKGCGNGYAGAGGTSPCIADAPCTGSPGNGHGRGMCQWGTSRWATQGKEWNWITDHYYSPVGNKISSPIKIVSVASTSASANVGGTLALATAFHNASLGRSDITATATLTLSGNPQVAVVSKFSVTVGPKDDTLHSQFQLPSDMQPGDYDLTLALSIAFETGTPAKPGTPFTISEATKLKAVSVKLSSASIGPGILTRKVEEGNNIHYNAKGEVLHRFQHKNPMQIQFNRTKQPAAQSAAAH